MKQLAKILEESMDPNEYSGRYREVEGVKPCPIIAQQGLMSLAGTF